MGSKLIKFICPLLICIFSLIQFIHSAEGGKGPKSHDSDGSSSENSSHSDEFSPYSVNPPKKSVNHKPAHKKDHLLAILNKNKILLNFPAICPANLRSDRVDPWLVYLLNLRFKCNAKPARGGKKIEQIKQEQKAKLFNLLISMQNDDRQMLVKYYCKRPKLWTSQQQFAGSDIDKDAMDKSELVKGLVEYSQECLPKFVAFFFTPFGMSPQFHDLALALLEDPIVYDAKNLHIALTGKFVNAETIFDILLFRSKYELQLIQLVYEKMFSKNSAQIKAEYGYFKRGKAERNARALSLMLTKKNIHGRMIIYLDENTDQYAQQKCGEMCAELFDWMAKRLTNVGNGQWKSIDNEAIWKNVKDWFAVPFNTYTDLWNHSAFIFQHFPADDIKFMILKPKMNAKENYTIESRLQQILARKHTFTDPIDFELHLKLFARMWQQLGIYKANPNIQNIIENNQHDDQAKRIMANIERKDYQELNRQLVSHSERDLLNISYQFQSLHKRVGYERMMQKMSKLMLFGKPKPISFVNAIFTFLYENNEGKQKLKSFNDVIMDGMKKFNEIQAQIYGIKSIKDFNKIEKQIHKKLEIDIKAVKMNSQSKLCIKPVNLANEFDMNINSDSIMDQNISWMKPTINAINENNWSKMPMPIPPIGESTKPMPKLNGSIPNGNNNSNANKSRWNWKFGLVGRRTNKMEQSTANISNAQNANINLYQQQYQSQMPKTTILDLGAEMTEDRFENKYRRDESISIHQNGHTIIHPTGGLQTVKIDHHVQNGYNHNNPIPFGQNVDTKIQYKMPNSNDGNSWPNFYYKEYQMREKTRLSIDEPNYYMKDQMQGNLQNTGPFPQKNQKKTSDHEIDKNVHHHSDVPDDDHSSNSSFEKSHIKSSSKTKKNNSKSNSKSSSKSKSNSKSSSKSKSNSKSSSFEKIIDNPNSNGHIDTTNLANEGQTVEKIIDNDNQYANDHIDTDGGQMRTNSMPKNIVFKFPEDMEKHKVELLEFNFSLYQKSTLLERFIYIFGKGALEYSEIFSCNPHPLNQEEIKKHTESTECKNFFKDFSELQKNVNELQKMVDVLNKCKVPIYKFYQPLFHDVCIEIKYNPYFMLIVKPKTVSKECQKMLKVIPKKHRAQSHALRAQSQKT